MIGKNSIGRVNLSWGLNLLHRFSGLRAILSGPAGGVVGYARTSYHDDDGVPVIGFDMVSKAVHHIKSC